jgi:hypothetical protein
MTRVTIRIALIKHHLSQPSRQAEIAAIATLFLFAPGEAV